MSPESAANFATATGILATTFAIVMFVVACLFRGQEDIGNSVMREV